MTLDYFEQLSKFKNTDLKYICNNNNLKKSGNKKQLIDRILKLNTKDIDKIIDNIKNKYSIVKLDNYIHKDLTNFSKNTLIESCKEKNINYKNSTKTNLINSINKYYFDNYEFHLIFIQNYYKYYIHRKINKLKGPALFNRSLCNNATDFFNLCDINTIPNKNFFSFKDNDNFIYGFEINSIYKMIDFEPINPYNRNRLSKEIIKNIKYIYKLINISSSNIQYTISRKTLQQSIIDVFQTMDNLGNYTNISWFLNLSTHRLKLFYKELEDIWHYRLSLTNDQRKQIVQPNGKLFSVPLSTIYHINCRRKLQSICIDVMDKLVNKGINDDCRKQGCYYILIALTIVNPDTAKALPWLANTVIN